MTLPSKVSIADICPLKLERSYVALFSSSKYKSHVRVGIRLQERSKVKRLIDTGAGPNLVRERL